MEIPPKEKDIPLVISIDCSGDQGLYSYVKDFEYMDKVQAKQRYDELILVYDTIPDGIDKDWFIDRGFTRF